MHAVGESGQVMAWGFNRHHIAKKVLERHMNDLDRKQARISNKRDENMRNLQRELVNLQAISTPDLARVIGAGNPLISRRVSHHFKSVSSKPLILPSPIMSHMDSSRLYSRRQSEPFGYAGVRTLSEVHRMLNTNLTISDDSENKKWNKVLDSTLPGSANSRPGMKRLMARRGTVAQTDGIRLLSGNRKDHLSKETSIRVSSGSVKTRPRRASLTSNEPDVKGDQDAVISKKPVEVKHKPVLSRKKKSYKEQHGVNVSFYNEDTGEDFIPSPNKDDPSAGDARSDAGSTDDDDKGTVWKEVAKCRYIRGYNPPEMREPDTDHATFVFGRDYNDVLDAQRQAKADHA